MNDVKWENTIILGTDPFLEFRVYYQGQQIYSTNLYLSIDGVEKMYRWINLRTSGGKATSTGQPDNYPDSLCSATNVFFLHGFNVTADGACGWSSEVFKRLYWSGSKAKFWGMTWDGDLGLINAFNYHENVANAFVTAANLNAQIKDIPGTKVIMAHSLGNMVVSSAIQDYNLSVDKYFMLEAAVPTESYNSSSPNVSDLVHEDWTGYNFNTWSANWHTLFSDSRANLTWINRFPNVVPVAYNFYSTGDECMELHTGGDPGFFTGTTSSFGRYCWQKQELWKGRNGLAGTSWAGWGFEGHFQIPGGLWVHEYTMAAANAANPSQLQTDPVFTHSPSALLSNPISQDNINQILAKGIPALSRPTGGNLINGAKVNHDVNGDDFKNGWGRNDPDYHDRWLHSDMKDMAYPYTHKIYDKLIEEGGL